MTQPSSITPTTANKLIFVDHLKVLLTVLVMLHHVCITYGAPGGWYYDEKTTLKGVIIPLTMLVSVNQSFFMGFFFFLSALFTPASYNKKGPAKFLADRLLRLGVPLVFYSLVLSPFLSYMVYYVAQGHHITYLQYLSGYTSWIDFGVLWFVAALLLFTLMYVLYRLAIPGRTIEVAAPGLKAILVAAVVTGLATYAVRTVFPVGYVLKPVGFQLGHFAQYIVLFIAGLMASAGNWLNADLSGAGKIASRLVWLLIFIGFPAFFVVRTLLNFPTSYFVGGNHWPMLWYAVWEQVTGFSIIIALLYLGKKRWNNFSPFLAGLGRCAFAVYIFHPLVVIALSMAAIYWHTEPALKLLVVAPLSIILSFALGRLIVKIPGVNQII